MIRIGCLGAARIAPHALAAPARQVEGVALSAVGARDPQRARAFAAAHGFARFGDYDAVIADPETDLVYIALPVHQHAPWAKRALEAGKHVLCEKPFAMNCAQTADVLETSHRAGRRVIEAFHYRYHPAFEQLLSWVREGRIGRLRRIEGELSLPIDARGGAEIRHLPECGGGAFMDLGCYPLNFALALTEGAPVSVEAGAQLTSRGVDEVMEARLVFESGAEAILRSSMRQEETFTATLRAVGEDGEIDFNNPVLPQLNGRLRLSAATGEEAPKIGQATTYYYQLRRVITALRDGSPLPTEADAILRQQSMLDRVYEAAGLGALRRA